MAWIGTYFIRNSCNSFPYPTSSHELEVIKQKTPFSLSNEDHGNNRCTNRFFYPGVQRQENAFLTEFINFSLYSLCSSSVIFAGRGSVEDHFLPNIWGVADNDIKPTLSPKKILPKTISEMNGFLSGSSRTDFTDLGHESYPSVGGISSSFSFFVFTSAKSDGMSL